MNIYNRFEKGGGKDNRVRVTMRKDENGAFVVVGITDIDGITTNILTDSNITNAITDSDTRNKNIPYNEEKEFNEKKVTE